MSDVYLVETLGRLAAHFWDCHPIEPQRTAFDLDAKPPEPHNCVDIYG